MDNAHKKVIQSMNPGISNVSIHVGNDYFRPSRIWMEKLYFWYRTLFR